MAIADRVVLVTGATGGLGAVVVRTFAEAGARLGLVGTDRDRLVAAAAAAVSPTSGGRQGWRPDRSGGGSPSRGRRHRDAGSGGRAAAPCRRLRRRRSDRSVRRRPASGRCSTSTSGRRSTPGQSFRHGRAGGAGVIAVTASTAVTTPPNIGAYSVAKAAEETLLRTLGREVAGSGVTVNVLAVRKIDTEHERVTAPSSKNAAWTTPEELASAMRYLCSTRPGRSPGRGSQWTADRRRLRRRHRRSSTAASSSSITASTYVSMQASTASRGPLRRVAAVERLLAALPVLEVCEGADQAVAVRVVDRPARANDVDAGCLKQRQRLLTKQPVVLVLVPGFSRYERISTTRVMAEDHQDEGGAGDGSRTRDMQLGRLPLCQLSYSRRRAQLYPTGRARPSGSA